MKDGAGTGKRALPIEDLLEWVYRVQRADLVLGRADNRERNWLAGAGISADGCASLGAAALLGTRIDYGPNSGTVFADLHPDAEAVHMQIEVLLRAGALSHSQVGLLLECGKTGGMPEWGCDEVSKPYRVETGAGARGYLVMGGKFNRYCPIRWEPPLALADDLRRTYGLWIKALILLHMTLSGGVGLTEFVVLPPAVPETPWRL